jgi:CBS domain-containing protein
MCAAVNQFLTAGDLMSRGVEVLGADLPLGEAAKRLAQSEIHGAPVVDREGRCVGVLSVTDLARWASGRREPGVQLPRTCGFQEKYREPGGQESTLCRLAEGACPFQRPQEMSGGRSAVVCREPHCVPVDWQVVEREAAPGESVRDFMTPDVVAVDAAAPLPELARLMLDRRVHRLIVLDPERRPVGVVAADDLLQVLAHPEIAAPGDER